MPDSAATDHFRNRPNDRRRGPARGGAGTEVALRDDMAIMWDAQKPESRKESASRVAWRLRVAQVLIASGWDAAVVRETLVPDQKNSEEDTSEQAVAETQLPRVA
jgi:hypothetical protein